MAYNSRMFPGVSSVIFYVVLALLLLALPGLALLRLAGSTLRSLDVLSRITIAPGITVALTALLFVWCDLCRVHPGPRFAWAMLFVSTLVLIIVRQDRIALPRWTLLFSDLRKIPSSDWFAAGAIAGIATIFLIVRFRAIWDWCVPPGVDTAQHTVITQLLIEHRGLFDSWAPYADGQTFTYHFGFHSIAAMFAWLTGVDAVHSVFIMTRVFGAVAAASLFAVVRLWTKNPWGGVFAAGLWFIYSDFLFRFDLNGRATLLAGLTIMSSALVLTSLSLRPESPLNPVRPVLLCALVAGGIIVSQYKSAIIFAALAATLFVSRSVAELFRGERHRAQRVRWIAYRAVIIGSIAVLLATPRLTEVMNGRSGKLLKRIVLEAPPATVAVNDKPTLSGLELVKTEIETRRQAAVSLLALLGVVLIAIRRREALWFAAGWILVTWMMNPAFIGSERLGIIDQAHWQHAIGSPIAILAGLTIGLTAELLLKRKSAWWNAALMLIAVIVAARATVGLRSLGNVSRYVMADDMRLFDWIRLNVPPREKIASRGFFEHGEVLGRDAAVWLPYFTRHRTNQTFLAAAMEKGPADQRQRKRDFLQSLYGRDASIPESANWMRDQGYAWFYVGALEQDKDKKLLEQLARNPLLEVARAEGSARLYHVR